MTHTGEYALSQSVPPEEDILREVLGYLNFSSGTPDPRFQRGINELWQRCGDGEKRHQLCQLLQRELNAAAGSSAAFEDVSQAQAVIPLVLIDCVQAYREFHRDLLHHLPDQDFEHPFWLSRVFEAVLSQGGPWTERERVLTGAVERLNDYIGYRPVAVLENEQRMQPYRHEYLSLVPLFVSGAGVAGGRYHDLIERTLQMFDELPVELQRDADFIRDHLEELSLDLRAYDHLHPVNKRTNYIFGEWDPHVINMKGFYTRFVVRRMILDALLDWIHNESQCDPQESLFDAASVLSGTILMASAISGSGPGAHDSSVSLTTLLPKVARHRDRFYAHLLENTSGARAKRLRREAQRSQQPFGHVRQHLNIKLSQLGAQQVHDRFLAQFFARLGFPDASRAQSARIPCPASRFESEIGWRLTSVQREVERGHTENTVLLLEETQKLIHRGIECGALVDPWNILGFQGQFPLFQTRDDSVPDQRIETLLDFMAQYFDAASLAMCEASASGAVEISQRIATLFEQLADWWDQFASTTVSDLPAVHGREAFESARSVAQAVSQWKAAGEAAGDVSVWRRHVDDFHSAQAYGRVVETLLQKEDDVAARGLLMQWLSLGDEVGLSSGSYSFGVLLLRWVQLLLRTRDVTARQNELSMFRLLFDFLEANAGDLWSIPAMGDFTGDARTPGRNHGLDDEDVLWDDQWGDDEEESQLFEAAYDGMIYRDSADDGNTGETLDDGYAPRDSEIESISREFEPRMDFLKTLAEVWRTASETLSERGGVFEQNERDVVLQWIRQVRSFRRGLGELLQQVAEYHIEPPTGNTDSNLEFDIQMQARYYLQHKIVAVASDFRASEWSLRSLLDDVGYRDARIPTQSRRMATLLRHVMRRDVVRIREELPAALRLLARQPLLYVSLENGGDPKRFLAARTVQSILTFLLKRLPAIGLLNETRQVLWTAYRMERVSRPSGTATTEFDRLLRTALFHSVQTIVVSLRRASRRRVTQCETNRTTRRSKKRRQLRRREFSPQPPGLPYRLCRHASVVERSEELRSLPGRGLKTSSRHSRRDAAVLQLVRYLVSRYESLWLKHSRSVRLSPVELLQENSRWQRVKEFIENYGDDLLHAPRLMLSNLRAILHQGVDFFLQFLEEQQDPLHPMKLLEDIDANRINREEACKLLELIYEIILDKLDRFIEYNTTTTQSDYGGMFYCLLDFLRVEADYERDAWNLRPYQMAHEVITRFGRPALARQWESVVEQMTRAAADKHLKRLMDLQEKYSIRLPSILDHLKERFVKTMAVDRMRALIGPALEESRSDSGESRAVKRLREEIDRYLNSTAGSAIEVPEWLIQLEREVNNCESQRDTAVIPAKDFDRSSRFIPIRPRQLAHRLTQLPRSRDQRSD